MNSLHVGFTKSIDLPKGGFLILDDEVRDIPRSRIFDPMKHSFNPMKGIGYREARELAELFYAISPQGSDTLTLRNGKRALARLFLRKFDRLDKIEKYLWAKVANKEASPNDIEALGTLADVLLSPVLKRVLCNPTNFSFNPNSIIQARINRVELGDFDALVLGLLLMSHAKSQLIVPDFGFYGRDIHSRLIREQRLIAGVNHLGELPEKLRRTALLIDEKIPCRATVEDAEELAKYVRPALGTDSNKYRDYIESAIA